MKNIFQIELDILAAEAWVAMGDRFGETGKWTSFLDSSHLEGELAAGGFRVCVDGSKKLTEHITRFDPKNLVLEYNLIAGRPGFLKSATNRWSIESMGDNRGRVTMSPNFEIKWWAIFLSPPLSLGFNVTLPKILEEFKHWAETGEVHSRKKAKSVYALLHAHNPATC